MGTQKNVRKFRQNQPESAQREKNSQKRLKKGPAFNTGRTDEYETDGETSEHTFRDE